MVFEGYVLALTYLRDMAQKRDDMSRFAVKYTDQELVHIVDEVARQVHPEDPASITQKQFDEGRAAAGYPDAPRAYRVAERLSRGWSDVLDLALGSLSTEISLSARETNQLRAKLTRNEVEHYLQSAARNLGVTELSVAAYDENRKKLVDADNRRYRHRVGLEETIPSSLTIIQSVGSWEKALSWAGLGYPAKRPPRSYPADKALDDFVSDYGFAPSYRDLIDYQARRGVRTESFRTGFTAWRQEQLEIGLASRHGNVPILTRKDEMPAGWKEKPISPIPEGYEMIRTGEITLDECCSDLLEASKLADGRLTQDEYQRLSRIHGLVALASIQKVAKRDAGVTWGQLRGQVIKENAKEPRTQGRRSPIK